jgi:hypothetical protein
VSTGPVQHCASDAARHSRLAHRSIDRSVVQSDSDTKSGRFAAKEDRGNTCLAADPTTPATFETKSRPTVRWSLRVRNEPHGANCRLLSIYCLAGRVVNRLRVVESFDHRDCGTLGRPRGGDGDTEQVMGEVGRL